GAVQRKAQGLDVRRFQREPAEHLAHLIAQSGEGLVHHRYPLRIVHTEREVDRDHLHGIRVEGTLLEHLGGMEVAHVHGLHPHLLPDLAHQAIAQPLPVLQSAAGELGDAAAPDKLIGHQYRARMEQQAVGANGEAWVGHAGRRARSISRLPGGPGRRSTVRPAACMARRTAPFAQYVTRMPPGRMAPCMRWKTSSVHISGCLSGANVSKYTTSNAFRASISCTGVSCRSKVSPPSSTWVPGAVMAWMNSLCSPGQFRAPQ